MTPVTATRPVSSSPRAGAPDPRRGAARPAAGRRPLLVVVPDPSFRRSRRILRLSTIAVVVATLAALFGVVALHVLLAEGQGAVSELESRFETAQETQQLLRTDVARLESPATVVAAARHSLGMVEPKSVVVLDPVAPPAVGADDPAVASAIVTRGSPGINSAPQP